MGLAVAASGWQGPRISICSGLARSEAGSGLRLEASTQVNTDVVQWQILDVGRLHCTQYQYIKL